MTREDAERFVADFYAVDAETARKFFKDEIDAHMRLVEGEEHMSYMKILDLIDRSYKVDGDWVYEKGKSQEIKIIKALLEEYVECRSELLELRELMEKST